MYLNCFSVCNLSKNTIWKQITTYHLKLLFVYVLYAIYQRTQSESKSQLWPVDVMETSICMQSIKEHNLKANHNLVSLPCCLRYSVCNLSKNTIWKQITTYLSGSVKRKDLYAIYQRTQSESKSQPVWFLFVSHNFCMQSIKEHNLKANHNEMSLTVTQRPSVCNLSKNTIWKQITTKSYISISSACLYAIYQRTQSESKSQQF